MDHKWNHRFLDLAEHVAGWSKDPSTKVGCVLVDANRHVVGMGYNGFPRGVADCADRYADREMKYLLVQHAEANAIHNATGRTAGAIAYVTHHPCATCTGLLIQAGVRAIVTKPHSAALEERFSVSFTAARLMAAEAGVEIHTLED